MIARAWHGWTRGEDADAYDRHYRSEVLDSLRSVPGFRGARLLRRDIGGETEFLSLVFFDDLAAVRAFAGAEYEVPVIAEAARRVLTRFDERVAHYTIAFEV